MISHDVNFHFLVANAVEHLFMFLFVIPRLSSVKCLSFGSGGRDVQLAGS